MGTPKRNALDRLSHKVRAVSENELTDRDSVMSQPATEVSESPKTSRRERQKKSKALEKLSGPLLTDDENNSEKPLTSAFPNSNEVFSQSDRKTVKPDDTKKDAFDYEKYEQDIELYQLNEEKKRVRHEKVRAILSNTLFVLLAIGCVYLIFLTYGAIKTEYVYNEDGTIEAQTLTVEQITNLNEYKVIEESYLRTRGLYEYVLLLDYRVAAGIEDPLVVAPEYDKALESVEKLLISVQALNVSPKYVQVQTMLAEWVKTDIAVYCQRMSSAISQNNAEHATQALSFRDLAYNDFAIITENMIALGATVHGADVHDIRQWSPENFIRNNVDGLY